MEKKDLRHLKRKELIDLIDKMQTDSDLVSNEEVKEELVDYITRCQFCRPSGRLSSVFSYRYKKS